MEKLRTLGVMGCCCTKTIKSLLLLCQKAIITLPLSMTSVIMKRFAEAKKKSELLSWKTMEMTRLIPPTAVIWTKKRENEERMSTTMTRAKQKGIEVEEETTRTKKSTETRE